MPPWWVFQKAAIARNPRVMETEPQEMEVATDGIRMLFYNKAYNQYFCFSTLLVQPGKTADDALACAYARNIELAKHVKIVSDYEALIKSKAAKATQCFLKSRLFDAEIEFPPFDFLRTSDGKDNTLYDYKALNLCLISVAD